MNVALWIVAGLMAAACLAGGATKAFQPRKKLVAGNTRWAAGFGDGAVRTVGALVARARFGSYSC